MRKRLSRRANKRKWRKGAKQRRINSPRTSRGGIRL